MSNYNGLNYKLNKYKYRLDKTTDPTKRALYQDKIQHYQHIVQTGGESPIEKLDDSIEKISEPLNEATGLLSPERMAEINEMNGLAKELIEDLIPKVVPNTEQDRETMIKTLGELQKLQGDLENLIEAQQSLEKPQDGGESLLAKLRKQDDGKDYDAQIERLEKSKDDIVRSYDEHVLNADATEKTINNAKNFIESLREPIRSFNDSVQGLNPDEIRNNVFRLIGKLEEVDK